MLQLKKAQISLVLLVSAVMVPVARGESADTVVTTYIAKRHNLKNAVRGVVPNQSWSQNSKRVCI